MTVVLWTLVLLLAATRKGNKFDMGRDDVALGAALLIIWPITLCILIPAAMLFQGYEERITSRLNNLMSNFEDDRREAVVATNESDLKFLLKLSRKEAYKERFSSELIVLLRDELLSRATEKSLLR